MMFKIVWGSFWRKLVKSRGFKPNGCHERFRSVKKIQIQPVRCQKGFTGTPLMTDLKGVGVGPRSFVRVRRGMDFWRWCWLSGVGMARGCL